MSVTVGKIELEDASENVTTVSLATARPEPTRYTRALFRAPYGATWHQAGRGERLPESVRMTFHVLDDSGIQAASVGVSDLLAVVEAAVEIRVPWATIVPAGILSVTRAPIEMGYRVDVVCACDSITLS